MNNTFAVDLSVTEGGRKRPEYTLISDLDGKITLADLLEFTKSSLIVISDEVLREEQSNGFDKKPVTIVDNKVGKNVATVHPLGQIEFVSRVNATEIFIATYEGLLGRSPVLEGDYISSHYVFLNGKQVANDLASLKAWVATNPEFKDNDFVRFVNIQPYGRKLERLGVTAGRMKPRSTKSKSKTGKERVRLNQPNGTYFLTARAIKSKYKRNSSVRFGFISGTQLGIKGSFKTGRKGSNPNTKGNNAGRAYLYPSITILISDKGTL